MERDEQDTAVGLSPGSRSLLFHSVLIHTPASSRGRMTLCRFEKSFQITGGNVSTEQTRFGSPSHSYTGTVGFAETPAPLGARQENIPKQCNPFHLLVILISIINHWHYWWNGKYCGPVVVTSIDKRFQAAFAFVVLQFVELVHGELGVLIAVQVSKHPRHFFGTRRTKADCSH